MTKPQHNQPQQMVTFTPAGAALGTAAMCMTSFAAMVWPIGRMWNAPTRDWEALAPALGLQVFLVVFAFVAIARYLVLARRDRPAPIAAPAKARASKHPARAQASTAELEPAPPAEPFRFSYAYPQVPGTLGRQFQIIMDLIAGLPFRSDDALDQLDDAWKFSLGNPGFVNAERFIVSKIERRADYDPNVWAEPLNPENVALYLAQATEVHEYAAIVAGMVLIAEELPEQVWDVLAQPWEVAGLDFPEVVLAG